LSESKEVRPRDASDNCASIIKCEGMNAIN
jgi:hypothetical protein